MAHLDKISTRYAKAFYEFLNSPSQVRLAANDLKAFATVVNANEQLQQVLTTEIYSEKERRGVIEDLASKLEIKDGSKKILLLLSSQKRLTHIESIAERLIQLVLEANDIVQLSVSAAANLNDDEKKKIETKFQKILGKQVEATYLINPELLGGLKVTAGGRTFDGSLNGWLRGLEEKLIGAR